MAPTRCCWDSGRAIIVMPREGGASSTPRLFGSITDVSGILDRPPSRAMTTEYKAAFPRRDAPEACIIVSPSEIRGRREDRVRAAPAVSCARLHKGIRTQAYRFSGGIRPSLRNGFTAYFVLSPVNGLSCHRRHADRSTQLDASIGASGPHDFAVRVSHARQSQLPRPPHPTARFVTIASRPSCRVRRAESNH
jgi:hypothetical protein